jgi:hypothetical protein
MAEVSESDVVASAAALVPTSRRARFDALYVALSQSPNGRSWSPAARAARAFALAGQGADDSPRLSAYDRAATAWDVLPVVYATSVDTELARESAATTAGRPGTARRRGAQPGARQELVAPRARPNVEMEQLADGPRVDTRPGLAHLSARAGEALGSYVSPVVQQQAPAASSSSSGAVLRAPTAAQELVRSGRPSGRHGGGEVEIPPWFEAAARKMLEERSGASDGISLAELTLVNAAPAAQVAASTRGSPGAQSGAPAHSGAAEAPTQHNIDVEKVANEVYRHILTLMDLARARNGEPYL